MNTVTLSGIIIRNPIYRVEPGNIPHSILSLGVRHRTRAGESRRETFRVSAWNTTADWAKDNLAAGQIVAVHGYLTQRKLKDGGSATEIAAEEFIPSHMTAFHQVTATGGQTIEANAGPDGITADNSASVAAENAPATDEMPAENGTPAVGNTPGKDAAA